MRPAWRLAISSASERPSRSVFLVLAVALSAALVSAVACAVRSVNASIEKRLSSTVGAGDLRVRTTGSSALGIANFDQAVLDIVRRWDEVETAAPRLTASVSLQFDRFVWEQAEVKSSGTGRANGRDGKDSAPARTGDFARVYKQFATAALGVGVAPEQEFSLRPLEILHGRLPAKKGEIVLDKWVLDRLTEKATVVREVPSPAGIEPPGAEKTADPKEAERLNGAETLRVGSTVSYFRLFRPPTALTVVGIVKQPPLGGRPQVYMTLETLQELAGERGLVSEIDLVLRDATKAEEVATKRRPELAAWEAARSGGAPADVSTTAKPRLLLVTTERVTSGVQRNIKSNELGFVLLSVMAFLAAGFIITTAMTTGVTERQRELAILRCIGATRRQLAEAQLVTGAMIGGLGSLVGVPLGVGLAAFIFVLFRDRLDATLVYPAKFLAIAFGGSLFSGLIGATIPAWKASRVSPLEALAARAKVARARGILITLAAGMACVCVPLVIVSTVKDSQTLFWAYALAGIPCMFVGYFLLGVPVIVAISRLLAPAVTRVLRVPPRMVERTIRATPYRFGFTAGAMMFGLAVMVAIWTQGSAILRDWLGKLEFPDGFVLGTALSGASQKALEDVPGVSGTSAITLFPIETDSFGVRAIQKYSSTYIAFDPDDFFPLARLQWVEGDQATAWKRLNEGGAILVAREFQVANKLGVGDRFRFWQVEGSGAAGADASVPAGAPGARDPKEAFDFEIVGVVTSPGLDIVSKFFQIGEEYLDQSIHAVFGTRNDLKNTVLAGQEPPITAIQFGIEKNADEKTTVDAVKTAMLPYGVLEVGSGRSIKEEIFEFVSGALLVSSAVAILAMVIAGFGVANLIIAGVHARRFEFGVLRAVGASRGVVVRLVLAEAVLIALSACVVGTLMGSQAVFAGQKVDAAILGIKLTARPPVGPILVGWVFVFVLTLAAAAPPVMALGRKRPRELLGAVRG